MMTVDCTTSDLNQSPAPSSSYKKHSNKYIPPYLRKLNRRYKQLYNLMEGIESDNDNGLSAPSAHDLLYAGSSIKDNKWMEANLFEEQREQNDQPFVAPPPAAGTDETMRRNSSSDNRISNSDELNEIPEDDRYTDRTSDGLYKVSPKSKKFMYHRVMSSSAANGGGINLGGGTSGRKQRLPFVAITNKRLQPSTSTSSSSKNNNNQINIQQNMFPMP